jgi:hypothetical protein
MWLCGCAFVGCWYTDHTTDFCPLTTYTYIHTSWIVAVGVGDGKKEKGAAGTRMYGDGAWSMEPGKGLTCDDGKEACMLYVCVCVMYVPFPFRCDQGDRETTDHSQGVPDIRERCTSRCSTQYRYMGKSTGTGITLDGEIWDAHCVFHVFIRVDMSN